MGYLSPGQLGGMGAVPEGRADPEACARLVNAKNYYDALKANRACSPQAKQERPGDCTNLTNAYSQWQALKSAGACRAAAPSPSAAPTPSAAPAPSAPRASLNLPTYTIPKRGPFGFKAARDLERQVVVQELAYGNGAQPVASIGRLPTWAMVALGVSAVALGLAAWKRAG